MVSDLRYLCERSASLLGNYKELTIDDLANGYLQADDDIDKESYYCALKLRFWREASVIYRKCAAISGFTMEDAFSVIDSCLFQALSAHAWIDSTKNLTPAACIRQVLNTRGAPAVLYESNLDKNKLTANLTSLDTIIRNDKDGNEISLADTLADESNNIEDYVVDDKVRAFIQSYIDAGKYMEAIIFDIIAESDSDRVTKKITITKTATDKSRTTEYYHEFWRHQCIKYLSHLPDNFPKHFVNRYKVDNTIFNLAFDKLRTASNQKLYRYLDRSLETARKQCTSRVTGLVPIGA